MGSRIGLGTSYFVASTTVTRIHLTDPSNIGGIQPYNSEKVTRNMRSIRLVHLSRGCTEGTTNPDPGTPEARRKIKVSEAAEARAWLRVRAASKGTKRLNGANVSST